MVYRGPFKQVEDDDGHVFPRGERLAVCDKTFHLLQSEPHDGLFDAIEPLTEIPHDVAATFDCRRLKRCNPRKTKGLDCHATSEPQADCYGSGEPCC